MFKVTRLIERKPTASRISPAASSPSSCLALMASSVTCDHHQIHLSSLQLLIPDKQSMRTGQM